MGKKDANKPRGRTTAYAYFIQTCRSEHKKKYPDEQIVFTEFSRKCADKWKTMGPPEKKRFDAMSAQDKIRYEEEMSSYVPPAGEAKRKKKTKDPNAPKRNLSAFFFFCGEFRASVKEENPSYGIGDVAKELGKRWEKCPNREKYDALAKADRARYEKDMAAYKPGSPAKKAKTESKPVARKVVQEEDDDDEDDDEDDEDDDDEEEEDDDEDDD